MGTLDRRVINMFHVPMAYLIIAGLGILSTLSLGLNIRQWWTGRKKDKMVASRVQSASVGRGLMAEQFAPFTETFRALGWDIQEFKFLGRPVDGIQFEDDEVIIVEFKTGDSSMSQKQRRIKNLVEDGKVRFQEIRF